MTRRQLTQSLAALIATVVLVGLVIQLFSTAGTTTGFFATKLQRTLNVFCFFTIWSNILLGVTSAILAANPVRRTPVFSAVRLAGVVSMVVTGVVYFVALRRLQDLHGGAAVANQILHSVDPVLAVVGWLVIGPRGAVSRRVIALSVGYPVLWLAATLVRGAAISYYPYPFLDATTHGYARVAVNCVIVAALFLGLAAGAAALDRVLPVITETPEPAAMT